MSTACVIVSLEESGYYPFTGTIDDPICFRIRCTQGYNSSITDREVAINPNAAIYIEDLCSTNHNIGPSPSDSNVDETRYILA